MDNSPNARDLWRRAWRLARKTGKHGKALYDALAPMGERETVCRAFIGIEAARANVKPLQLTLSEIVLNNWGTKNPFLCPSMDSPRFNGWRRIASLQQALRDRMAARGMICKDSDDNWFTGFDLAA